LAYKVTASYCYNRAGHWETKSQQATARGKYDKAGEYRTKALQWAQRGKRVEENNDAHRLK
jgi:hypothetical protein